MYVRVCTYVFLLQVQFRYKAVQALISHLDKKNQEIDNPSAKRGILDTVSQCIQVASEGFLGPSAMDAFTVLLKHLKGSLLVDNMSVSCTVCYFIPTYVNVYSRAVRG